MGVAQPGRINIFMQRGQSGRILKSMDLLPLSITRCKYPDGMQDAQRGHLPMQQMKLRM